MNPKDRANQAGFSRFIQTLANTEEHDPRGGRPVPTHLAGGHRGERDALTRKAQQGPSWNYSQPPLARTGRGQLSHSTQPAFPSRDVGSTPQTDQRLFRRQTNHAASLRIESRCSTSRKNVSCDLVFGPSLLPETMGPHAVTVGLCLLKDGATLYHHPRCRPKG